MIILKLISYSPERGESPGALFDRIIISLGQLSAETPKIFFCFTEFTHRKISPIDRILKRFPVFKSYEYTAVRPDGEIERSLTNMSRDWTDHNPLGPQETPPLNMLLEIARGVPNPYSLGELSFVFEGLRFLDQRPASESEMPDRASLPFRPFRPAICILNRWGQPRRNELSVCLYLRTPKDSASPLDLIADKTRNFLDSLGRIKREEVEPFFLKAEHERNKAMDIKVRAITRRYEESMKTRFSLPEVSGVAAGVTLSPNLPSLKTLLVAQFKPLGYKYDSHSSGQGAYVLRKRTNDNHKVEVEFERGTWSESLDASFSVYNPMGGGRITLQFWKGPIMNEEHLLSAIRNCADHVQWLEQTFVKEIETLFGPAPAWYD